MYSFAASLRAHAARRPDHAAVTTGGGRTLSYRELDALSSRVANALIGVGVEPGDRVAHVGRNRAEFAATMFGASKVRATLAGASWRLAVDELGGVLADADPKVVVVDEEFAANVQAVAARVPGLRQVVVAGATGDFDTWTARVPSVDPGLEPRPDDVVLITYTSGTTGLPKGVMATNSMIEAHLTRPMPWCLDPASVMLVVSPVFHAAGSAWVFLGVYHGAHVVLLPDANPRLVLRAVGEHRVTHTMLVPALIQFMLQTPECAGTDLSSLRTVVYGASPISETVLSQALETFGCELAQGYGMTETLGPITFLYPADHDPALGLLRSAGRPSPGIELAIVDPETGEERPPGEVGEVWTRSDQNTIGYWRKPEETGALFRDGWLRTGDAGYVDDRGYLFLTDRVKDMIVSGGENVYPVEVENALMAHPAVADVAVVGVPDERWGETVKAVVVAAPGGVPVPDELIAHCRERLAGFKCPTSVDLVDELPRNPSGKVLRRLVREPYWKGRARLVQ